MSNFCPACGQFCFSSYQLVKSKQEIFVCSECEETVIVLPITNKTSLKIDDFFDSMNLSHDWNQELIMIAEFVPLRNYSEDLIKYIVENSCKEEKNENHLLSQMDEQDQILYNFIKGNINKLHQ